MTYTYLIILIAAAVSILEGCALVPPMPSNADYPVTEILRYAACELKTAYTRLSTDPAYSKFKAREYAVTIQLQPKVDLEFNLRGGLTDKSSSIAKAVTTLSFGAATGAGSPGAGFDTLGHQDGSVYYIAKSADLIDDKAKTFIDCDTWSSSYSELAHNLDIQGWLYRSTEPTVGWSGPFSVDKHSFMGQVTIQFDAAGGFTYTFPLGSNFAFGSGRYKIEKDLTITTVHEEPKTVIRNLVTLPKGRDIVVTSVDRSGPVNISPETRTRLDLLQLQQSIQSLQITVPRQ